MAFLKQDAPRRLLALAELLAASGAGLGVSQTGGC